jgi:hypothetical protein
LKIFFKTEGQRKKKSQKTRLETLPKKMGSEGQHEEKNPTGVQKFSLSSAKESLETVRSTAD